MAAKPVMAVENFFNEYTESRRLFEGLKEVLEQIGPYTLRVSKSQIAICRRKPFAWAWVPGRYLHGKTAPLVLTVAFPEKESSPRWKEVVQVAQERFMHHLELYTADDLDDEVASWLQSAWKTSGK